MRTLTFERLVLLAAAFLLPAHASPGAAETVLVRDGESRCVIVAAPGLSEESREAVEDLVRCLRTMSGAAPDVVAPGTEIAGDRVPIRVGLDLDDPFLKTAGTDQAFVLRVTTDRITVSGASPSAPGTMFGVYDLLEELGMRWFMPGELGEVIPEKRTVTLRALQKLEKPDFIGRRIQYSGHYRTGQETPRWERRVKLSPSPGIPGSHAFRKWIPKDEYFEKNPEYFSLIDGERTPAQLCTSNPEVVRVFSENILASLRKNPRVVVPIGPNDGSMFCQCDACEALDTGDLDPHYGRESATDRLMIFFNQVAERVGPEFPDAKFSFYIYSTHCRPPVKLKPHPSLIGMIAANKLCTIHGPGEPQCPERSVEWVNLARVWSGLLSEVWNRDYGSLLYGGACFPLSLTHRWREEIPLCKQLGFRGYRVETWVSWAGQMLDPYLMAKLWWNADLDVDALVDDYFTKFFGPAAEPMQRYRQRIDDATAATPYHAVGWSALNLPHWYPPELVQAGAKDLQEAAELARTSAQERRVAIFRQAHDALEHILRMGREMEKGRFEPAAEAYQQAHEIAGEMCAGDPPLLDTYAFVHLYQDWDQSCHTWNNVPHYSRLAADRVTGGNELVALLPKTWWMQIDPMQIGETQGWHGTRAFSSVDWVECDTHTSAMNQGLANYRGPIWYRCSVRVPERFAGRTVKLYFAGMRGARVWVNGRMMGDVPVIQPREIDVSAGIEAGQDNLVAVRCKNEHGIYRPAFLWSPPER